MCGSGERPGGNDAGVVGALRRDLPGMSIEPGGVDLASAEGVGRGAAAGDTGGQSGPGGVQQDGTQLYMLRWRCHPADAEEPDRRGKARPSNFREVS